MSYASAVIIWYRNDLRILDHPGLQLASELGKPVIPVYIHEPESEGNWKRGGASKWWLHNSLKRLNEAWQQRGARLYLFKGKAEHIIPDLMTESGADALTFSVVHHPAIKARDKALYLSLEQQGVQVHPLHSSTLLNPKMISNLQGKHYRVFTPFFKRILPDLEELESQAKVEIQTVDFDCDDLRLEELNLLPKRDWADAFPDFWQPGEASAHQVFNGFLHEAIHAYKDHRDLPGIRGTSRLSAHLHFGEISPIRVLLDCRKALTEIGCDEISPFNHKGKMSEEKGLQTYIRELCWREFASHLMHHEPHTTDEPLNPKFDASFWEVDHEGLKAWQKGMTGYPIVDAGMRELWATGWMHNRVRMIVASFLVKDLRINWVEGAKWFWDTLVDADLPNNSLGWQWAAGCGADAAPYFRIFNPISQGERWDPDGVYVRKWCPELKTLPKKYVHAPWTLPLSVQAELNWYPGQQYPMPIVDHAQAREEALALFERVKAQV